MNRHEILIIEGYALVEMARELCRRAALADLIRKTCPMSQPRIRIKPNLLGPIPAQDGATTHPEIVEGIVGYLREEGFREIAVMESSWIGDRTSDSLLVTGFGDLCRRLKVPFLDLQEDRGVSVNGAGMELHLCQRALEADFLINVPVLKGHCQTGMTCALKNMKGCIPASEKRRFHRMGLHDPIGHLSAAIRQDFILADAVCPDLTFEDGGSPVPLNRMLCALDPVLLDAYGARVIGISPDDVGYIAAAQKCGVGSADTARAVITSFAEKREGGVIRYTESDIPELPWKPSDALSLVRLKSMVSDIDSCSACYGALLPVLRRLEEEGLLDRIRTKICIGQGYRGRSGETGIGNCTSGFRNSLPGCPPSGDEMYEFLKKLDV